MDALTAGSDFNAATVYSVSGYTFTNHGRPDATYRPEYDDYFMFWSGNLVTEPGDRANGKTGSYLIGKFFKTGGSFVRCIGDDRWVDITQTRRLRRCER
ncbi:hypothetical protein [Thermomonospora umbrina]|uniref:Uncharacterized protein n=1 Tax=Thermomonospora umbrina TaxID=111806 RepID=A0A3D9T525_9ACTN|nr:hypothetical protein [Thermomonospora umbrina]REF00346.1 hypothetical protein DFJ69_5878 [Thermomonospora umbrina]